MKSGEIRHAWPDRLFHWVMAALVIVLLGTAFLPIAGVRFGWVTIHWVSGLLLTAAVLFHLYRVVFVSGLGSMLPTLREISNFISRRGHDTGSKYDLPQKTYHWSVALVVLALLVTGLVMLAKIDTPFWNRDPAVLTDHEWGLVYAFHGGAGLLLIFFFILHVYFAFLPEHRQLLAAMIFGRPVEGREEETSELHS